MRLRSDNFRFKNVFGRKVRRKSALRSRILSANDELIFRPRFHFPLHIDLENVEQIRTEN